MERLRQSQCNVNNMYTHTRWTHPEVLWDLDQGFMVGLSRSNSLPRSTLTNSRLKYPNS